MAPTTVLLLSMLVVAQPPASPVSAPAPDTTTAPVAAPGPDAAPATDAAPAADAAPDADATPDADAAPAPDAQPSPDAAPAPDATPDPVSSDPVSSDANGEPKDEKLAAGANQWNGLAGFGLILLTGNARSLSLNGSVTAERKTERWITQLRANGAYGQARPLGTEDIEVVALNATVQARGDLRFTPRYSGYLLAGIDTDHVASIEARPFVESGLGILWINEERKPSNFEVRTDLALRYGRELRFQYYPVRQDLEDVTILAPRLAGLVRYPLSEGVVFSEEIEVLPNVVDEFRVLANSTTKLNVMINERLSFGLAYLVRYDSEPAPGKLSFDTSLTLSLEATL